jgi:hypothetical protein
LFYCARDERVEGEIGRFRRRHLTPVQHAISLPAVNQALPAADTADDARRIAARAETAAARERPTLRALPDKVFDVAQTLSCRVDVKARVCVRGTSAASTRPSSPAPNASPTSTCALTRHCPRPPSTSPAARGSSRRARRAARGSGTGKTHLLIGLGTAAAEAGRRVRYVTTAALVNELVEAADDKQLSRVVGRYARLNLLCLDLCRLRDYAEARAVNAC